MCLFHSMPLTIRITCKQTEVPRNLLFTLNTRIEYSSHYLYSLYVSVVHDFILDDYPEIYILLLDHGPLMCISSVRWLGGDRAVGIRLYIIKKCMILLILVCPFWFYFFVLCISYMIQWKYLNSVSYKFKPHLWFSRAYGTCYFSFWKAKSLLWWAYCILAKNEIVMLLLFFYIFWAISVQFHFTIHGWAIIVFC